MSLATIRRKIRALEKHGLAGLLRKARADRGAARVADAKVIARIQTDYLKPYQPTAASIYKEVARDYELSGLKAPSYSFVRRAIGAIEADLVARFRFGEREFDDKLAYVTLRKKPPLPRQWCDADHHILDHVVIFDDGSIGRPWLTAIQDISTNEILGYLLSHEKRATYPGSNAIALTLRQAILKKSDPAWPSFGLFDNFYTDLGKDFRAQYIRAVCTDLAIQVRYARGYHGKSKPIERFFGTLENGIKHLPGYVGRSPEHNPLKAHIGAPRDWESLRGEIMTVGDFSAALNRWIVGTYHHTESRALKDLSPMGALEAHVKNGWAAREVASDRALDLLLMRRAGKKVQRFGVQLFSSGHTQRYFMAPELIDLIGQEVEVCWDPQSVGEVVIYKDHRFVCTAQNRELLDFGATEEDLKSERELKRKQRDSLRARMDELQKQAQYPNDLARAQAESRMQKIEAEEIEKIAVNAKAPSAAVLLPKYAGAAKNLQAIGNRQQATAGGRKKAARSFDDLKSSEELFAPLYDDGPEREELKSSEEIFQPIDEE